MHELLGLDKQVRSIRGSLKVEAAKKVKMEEHIKKEKRKLERLREYPGEYDDGIQDDITKWIDKLSNELKVRQESINLLKGRLMNQITSFKETIAKVLDSNTSRAEKIRRLFREQGITITSILTAIGMAIGVLVEALLPGGGGGTEASPPPPKDEKGLKEWIRNKLKGNLRSKKKLSSNERAWKMKKKKTSHHRPQCAEWFSRYSISKSGIWERWTSPFCRFWASFSIKYDVTDAILQDNEKLKVQYLRSLLFGLFETLQAVRTWQRNFASFQILLLWQPESKLLSIIEKTKGLLFKQNWCSKSNLKQYSLIATAGSIMFWRKMDDTLFLLWKNNSLLFLNKGQLFSFELPQQWNLTSSEIHLFTSNSLQNFKQIRQKTHEVLHFHFFNVLQHWVYDVIFKSKRG